MPRTEMRWLEPLVCCLAMSCNAKVAKLLVSSHDQELRKRSEGERQSSPSRPPILILALDGVSRGLLYDMLRKGELPNFEALLGGDKLAHADLDETMLSTLPSTTMAAWVTAMTGVTPATHGVTGNEYFIRETRDFACPAPVSFSDPEPTLAIYTDHYLDKLAGAPTVYERIRAFDPEVLIWVTMNHLFRGADRLLMARRTAIVKAFEGFIEKEIAEHASNRASPKLYSTLDSAAVDVLIDHLGSGPTPDILTLYMSGTDLYAHVATEGPDEARRNYLRDVVDGQLARVVEALQKRGVLDRTWVVTLADHGHTQVMHDEAHALGDGGDDAPPMTVLHHLGFRTRPLKHHVDAKDPFSAVMAYGGAMAYVYLADRSRCAGEKDVCDWFAPPRYDEDVLAVAEAYYLANQQGAVEPRLKGTLDMVLVRKPRPFAEVDLPFEVYVGDGHTVPLADYLEQHPHPTYVDVVERMHDLAVGPHGERAGDVLLIAHDGDVERPEERYYFAAQYHSWHGSPSKRDSEVPLIVANRHHRTAEIARWVTATIGPHPRLQKVTDILLGLRKGALDKPAR